MRHFLIGYVVVTTSTAGREVFGLTAKPDKGLLSFLQQDLFSARGVVLCPVYDNRLTNNMYV